MTREILLIGVGNEFRGDDAAGLLVARNFSERNLLGVTVIESSGEGAALMEAWAGRELVILVDAVSSAAPPGSVHRFELSQGFPSGGPVARSSHAFGVAEAVAMSKELRRLPTTIVFYGIEGTKYDLGMPLSAPVAGQLPALIRAMEQELLQLRGTGR